MANERDARKHNETAQIDLVLGQLTAHLQDIWYDRHGPHSETPRKRGDTNAPTMTEFVKAYAGQSASWCQRCLSAYEHMISDSWGDIQERLDGKVGVEEIIKAARDPNRPTVRHISKVQKKLDQFADAVRQRAFNEAVDGADLGERGPAIRKPDVTSLLLY